MAMNRTPATLDFQEISRDITTSVLNTASTLVADANRHRSHLIVVNDGNNIIYLALGKTAVANRGIRINANGGGYEINRLNMFKGQINAIAVTGTTVLVGEEVENRYAD